MGSIFIAMPKKEDTSRMLSLVQSLGLPVDIEICSSGAEILRLSHDRDFGLVICTKRLRDMSYLELADYLPYYVHMIVFTSDLSLEAKSDRVMKMSLPFRRGDFEASVQLSLSPYLRRDRKKKHVPKRSLEEQQIIDQAKEMLMERNGMTEPEAFRYIQKNSMDTSRSMIECAQMVLLMYHT